MADSTGSSQEITGMADDDGRSTLEQFGAPESIRAAFTALVLDTGGRGWRRQLGLKSLTKLLHRRFPGHLGRQTDLRRAGSARPGSAGHGPGAA